VRTSLIEHSLQSQLAGQAPASDFSTCRPGRKAFAASGAWDLNLPTLSCPEGSVTRKRSAPDQWSRQFCDFVLCASIRKGPRDRRCGSKTKVPKSSTPSFVFPVAQPVGRKIEINRLHLDQVSLPHRRPSIPLPESSQPDRPATNRTRWRRRHRPPSGWSRDRGCPSSEASRGFACAALFGEHELQRCFREAQLVGRFIPDFFDIGARLAAH
jgi:hypothetical protein